MSRSKSDADADSAALTRKASGCATIIAVPLMGIGLLIVGFMARNIFTWVQMKSWVETPAIVLETSTDASEDNGDSLTVKARYSYAFAGRQHESRRVAIDGGGDNLGGTQRDRGRQLEEAVAAGGKFRCFVNPSRPAEAVLYRELRTELQLFKLFFGLLFGGVGGGIWGGARYGLRAERRKEELRRQHPGQPWMWREDWASGRMRSSAGCLAWFLLMFAVVWNAVSWPACWQVWQRGGGRFQGGHWLILIFPLSGLGVGLWAIYLWLRRWKWGRSELELGTLPGVLGGKFAAVIHIPRKVRAVEGFNVQLSCNETTVRKGSEGDETSEKALWCEELVTTDDLAKSIPGQTIIPVEYEIPDHLPPTGDKIHWRLTARAETWGVDYCAEFEVPVFRTAASDRKPDKKQPPAKGKPPIDLDADLPEDLRDDK